MNKTFYPSIFNDVLAPYTQGPSSSNTVGPYRISKTARSIIKGVPNYLRVEMSENGGFKDTFFSMDSDKAFILGAMDGDIVRDDLSSVYQRAEKNGLCYEFVFSDKISPLPSEAARLTLRSKDERIELFAVSLGGGEILISEINGQQCEIDGRHCETVKLTGEKDVREIPSVYPTETIKGAVPPFRSSSEMLEYADREGLPLWKAAERYESALTGLSAKEIREIASDTLKLSYESIKEGYENCHEIGGVTTAKAAEFIRKAGEISQIPAGAAAGGALDALALMENGCGHGKIVCMPTGGAAGVIPAVIKNCSNALGKGMEEQINALLTCGIIGVFYYPTHYHGSLGCQAEVGIAASMAAAGLASMISDDPKVCEKSAVLAMQCLIGQVCDPIGGYVQIPCFIRNASAVSLAVTCANFAALGLDTCVSLDGMVRAVMRVGEKIRSSKINDLGTCMSSCEENAGKFPNNK